MARKQISFFATRVDICEVLEETALKTNYLFSCLDINSEVPKVYQRVDELDDLSVALCGDQSREKFYLLICPGADPITRAVEQSSGEQRYFFDQLSHPASVMLRPGGVMKDLDCIICGQLGTVSNDEWSEALYKVLSASIRKRFTKIKSYYLGTEAIEKMDEGYRLTSSVNAPKEYDLLK